MPFINDKLKYYLEHQEEMERRETPEEGLSKLPITRFTFQKDQIMDKLRESIFGQDESLEKISSMLKVVHADITEKQRPLYIAMLMGPTGVGKTEMVKILAEAIYGERDSFCRIDMNTLAQEHYAAAITGAPPGYVGSKEGTTVFDEDKISGSFSKPGIVLLDEIEKADSSVIQSLLNVFDNGRMILTNGERIIDFRNAMIFMTSNLGSKQIFEFAEHDFKSRLRRWRYKWNPANWGNEDHLLMNKVIQEELENHFSPEFLNRIDDTMIFNWLGTDSLVPIIDKLIGDLNERLVKHQCSLELDDEAKDFLIRAGFHKHYGARSIKRAIRKHVEVPLAEFLEENLSAGTFLRGISKQGKIVFLLNGRGET